MDISGIVLIFACFLILLFFFPDIFPRCSCCRRIKFAPLIKIHKFVKTGLGYHSRLSVCRRCCRKYSIQTLSDYYKIKSIKKKIDISMKKDEFL